jgi:ketosteroid isomerase-like protein
MPSPNLDLVRSIYADWERGDFSSAAWGDPDIEITIIDGPAPGTWTGVVGAAESMREFLDAWEEVRFGADEYRKLDGERVLVLDHAHGRGKASGLEIGQTQTKGAHLFHVRGGKVTRVTRYWDRERAFADLGLAPEADAADARD